MIYFDNAASGGRKPDSVVSAVRSTLQVCANPGRSGHKLALSCANIVQSCRYALNDYFHGYGFDRVVFTKNCTEALNIALLGVLKKGDHVVATCMEHNSVLRPLDFLHEQGVVSYDICPLDESGNINAQTLLSLVKENTKLVAVTTASNVTGATPPVAQIRHLLPPDTLLLCDGAQGGGHLPLHLRELGVDLLAIAGHKGLMAMQGSGALLFSERVDPTPLLFGGTGSLSVDLAMPDFYPDALEAGTLSYPAIVSLLEGVRFLSQNERQHRAHMLSLTAYFLNGLKELKSYKAYSQANACGIVAFQSEKRDSEQVAEILSEEYDIAVRGGLHCAPLMHRALNTLDGGLVRVSFSIFNSEKEVDELLFALRCMQNA